MMTKKDIETLAAVRLDDATHLFQASRYSAAYYLAGYAVELGIKVCIASHIRADTIPDRTFVNDIYSHKLKDLLVHAELQQELQKAMANHAVLSANWGVASKWKETSRYEIGDQFAAAGMLQAVGDQNHGVLQWLKKHW